MYVFVKVGLKLQNFIRKWVSLVSAMLVNVSYLVATAIHFYFVSKTFHQTLSVSWSKRRPAGTMLNNFDLYLLLHCDVTKNVPLVFSERWRSYTSTLWLLIERMTEAQTGTSIISFYRQWMGLPGWPGTVVNFLWEPKQARDLRLI